MKAFLANVMDAYVYSGDTLLFTSKALTDSSISISVTPEEIRGGQGNKLWGRYFHDSSFSLELQDALFELDYIAHNVGSTIVTGTDGMLVEEQITATGTGSLTVSSTPYDFLSLGTIGWISEVGEDDWSTFTFEGSSATDVTLSDGTSIVSGDTYCVKYMAEATCDEITIGADFIPDEVSVVLKGNLYKASRSDDTSTSSVIGYIQVLVPRFQLSGSMDISLSSSGAAQIPFSGEALVTLDSSAGCDSGGYYAVVQRFDTSANWYDGLVAFALEGSDTLSVTTGSTTTLNIYGIYSNGSAKLINYSNLDYTVSGSVGTVSSGVFTAASSAGSGTITVVCANSAKPTVQLVIDVTVSAS